MICSTGLMPPAWAHQALELIFARQLALKQDSCVVVLQHWSMALAQ